MVGLLVPTAVRVVPSFFGEGESHRAVRKAGFKVNIESREVVCGVRVHSVSREKSGEGGDCGVRVLFVFSFFGVVGFPVSSMPILYHNFGLSVNGVL